MASTPVDVVELPDSYDIVVVGGGAAGTSLVRHLAATGGADLSVLLIDELERPLDGRTWAFWEPTTRSTSKHSASPGVDPHGTSHTPDSIARSAGTCFDRFVVQSPSRRHVVRLTATRYRAVTGAELEDELTTIERQRPRFRRARGRVDRIVDGSDSAEVVVGGQTVRAAWVFDSVGLVPSEAPPPAALPCATAPMSLRFTGRVIESAEPVFDQHSPVLMDFRTDQRAGLAFVYVLPTSPTVAMVEQTWFSTAPLPSAPELQAAELALDRYLTDALGVRSHHVRSTERGQIPLMTAPPAAPGHRVVPIGSAAGLVKASTGYGYARIDDRCATLARTLAERGAPEPTPPATRRHRLLDRLLLSAIEHEPDRVVTALVRLFRANDGDTVLRFLDEETSVREELAIILTMPPSPFLRAAARVLRGR